MCVCTPCGLYSNDKKQMNIVFCLVVIGSKTVHTIIIHTSLSDKDKSYSIFVCLYVLMRVMVAMAGRGGGGVKQTFYHKPNP